MKINYDGVPKGISLSENVALKPLQVNSTYKASTCVY